MRKTVIAGLLGSAFALAGTAQAALLFDVNGTGDGGLISATAFDWAPTSFLARGGNTAIANLLNGRCGEGGDPTLCDFNVHTHARLTQYSPPGGGWRDLPGGLGEITMVASYTERVTGFIDLGGGLSQARFSSTGIGWLEFYWSPSIDSVDLTGSGFNNGTLIGRLDGVASGVTGLFEITNLTQVALDQSGNGNQYTGQQSVSGFGSNFTLRAGTTGVNLDPNFFITTLAGFEISFDNISIGLPFRGVDPSNCFTPAPRGVADPVGTTGLASTCGINHADATFAGQPGNGGYLPVIGTVNGFGVTFVEGRATVVSPDVLAQTDFNSAVMGFQEVPEPGTLALVGLALAGLGVAARRRRA